MTTQNSTQIALPKLNIPPCSPHSTWWSSNLRDEAQEIVPGLWIGPLSVLKDTQFLEDQAPTRVLISLTDTNIIPAIVKYKYEALPDYTCYSFDPGNKKTNPLAIVSQLAEICKVIHDALFHGTATLVFCESGNEQSAVVAAAYLIYSSQNCNLEMIPAVQAVQRERGSVSLDDAAKHNLQTFRDLCRAHVNCELSRGVCSTTHEKVARVREDDEEEVLKTSAVCSQKRQYR